MAEPDVVAAPAPSPAPSVVQEPPAEPAKPVDFTFTGELEQGGWMRGDLGPGQWTARLGEEEIEVDPDGLFFAAFDRDSPSTLVFEATSGNLVYAKEVIKVAPRDWDIEYVDVALRPRSSSESFMKKRRPELDAIWDARLKKTGSEGWKQSFIWPATGRISGRFGSQRVYRGEPGSYHSGLDIAGGSGTTYVAPADGVVVLAERDFSLEGQLLIIDHGQGLNSAFLHSSELFVREGDRVQQGQPLGRIGSSGRATGPHLHWSLKWKNFRLDPLLFLPPQP
ncbi:M23 family metallopeptidase [Qipengyuania intermedia]|uniref:M23 family metallopeptidase n=1 Tax=Qipengyuania intermedia TaxID=2867244 RepID=UPI0031ECF55A